MWSWSKTESLRESSPLDQKNIRLFDFLYTLFTEFSTGVLHHSQTGCKLQFHARHFKIKSMFFTLEDFNLNGVLLVLVTVIGQFTAAPAALTSPENWHVIHFEVIKPLKWEESIMMKHFMIIMAKNHLSAVTLATNTSLSHSPPTSVTYDPHTTERGQTPLSKRATYNLCFECSSCHPVVRCAQTPKTKAAAVRLRERHKP